MHIKRLLSCTMAALMTITSFNLNVMAAELPDVADDGANVVEEQQVDIPVENDADGQEDCPALPDGPLVIHERANPQQAVADSRSAKPQTLAESLQVLGSYL